MADEIDAKYIINELYREYGFAQPYVAHNTFFGRFESDFIYMTNSGYVTEIEIKVSRNDYTNDFKKYKDIWIKPSERTPENSDIWTKRVNRHELLKSGETGYKRFYFAMPEELAESVGGKQRSGAREFPDYCGLFSISKNGRKETLIKAPLLPGAKKFGASDAVKMIRPNYYRALRKIIHGVWM